MDANPFKLIGLVVLALVVLTITLGSWFTVDQGERVVVLTNGRISSVKDAGIYFKAPLIQSIEKFSVRTERTSYENVETYSKDIQTAHTNVTVNHRLNPAKVADVYQSLGVEYGAKVINPAVMSTIKVVFGRYSATESIDNRQKLVKEMTEAVAAKLEPYGIIVDSVSVENISFSEAYNRSVEDRMKAEVEVQKAKQTLLQEQINADIARTSAKGTADSAVMAAQGKAKAIAVEGEAQNKILQERNKILQESPNLISYTLATQWDGKLPTTMLPNQGLPMIKLPGQ